MVYQNCKYICQNVCKNVQWSDNSTHEQWGGTGNLKTKTNVKGTHKLALFLSCLGKNKLSNAATVQLIMEA